MSECLPALIVDDSEICLTGMSFMLARHGFATQFAKNAPAALALLASSNFSAVLLDYQMVGLTGAGCASEIRRRESASGSRIPIIDVASQDDAGVREKCLTAGMDVVLSKDIEEEELVAVLKSCTEGAA